MPKYLENLKDASMLRTLFLIGTTAFWLTMTSRLIDREYFKLTTLQTAYEFIPLTTTAIREDYKGVYLGDERIGFDYKGIQLWEEEKREYKNLPYELHHNSYLSFLLLGRPSEMAVMGRAWLDEELSLGKFKIHIHANGTLTKIQGEVKGDKIFVGVEEGEGEPVQHALAVQGKVLYSEILENIWTPTNLRVGKQGRFQVFNPLLLTVEEMTFRVDRKETISHHGKNVEAFVIYVGTKLFETGIWVDPDGKVLRRETGNGLVMKSEPGWEIFDGIREKTKLPDLPHLYSIPSNLILEQPGGLQGLEIKLITDAGEQLFRMEKENFEGLEKTSWNGLQGQEDFTDSLASSEWVQSGDPEIQKLAKEIVGDETSVLRAALKIMEWVHENMSPQPTAGIPSAQQVLKNKRGDCNEYTVLFTALARAAGIPTRMIAGLVYQNGRFFYHAWPGIYAGRWVSVDPTLNQAPVDVTHLPLVIGDVKEQVSLAGHLGQIKVVILKAK